MITGWLCSFSAYKLWHIMRTSDQEKAERLFFEDFLTKVPDADIDLEWELHSWVPFVSRFLPSDKCRVRKKGNRVRVDMSLKGFQDFGWLRGDISFLLDGSRLFDEKVVMLDHDQKLYECVTSQLSEVDSAQFDLEWSLIASSPVIALRILHDNISCVPNYSGWFNSEQQKVDQSRHWSTVRAGEKATGEDKANAQNQLVHRRSLLSEFLLGKRNDEACDTLGVTIILVQLDP
ncbi:unnamed protein product [Schistocephalus solidus]|uniref:Aha1_N domain-containing protein n=1 Tax=Schistocephalus solidus TaxID=70667 RepID=A0A183TJM1_SCHSO|nr:unnamed protein product [Schistocephalus solidus]